MMLSVSDMTIPSRLTVEEVPPGPLPQWVNEQAVRQARNSISMPDCSKMIFIYPNQASRREMLDLIENEVPAFDRSAHHTLGSLTFALGADLQLQNPMKRDPVLDECTHILTARAAEKLRFPYLHPLENRVWHRSKTEALIELHSTLSTEDSIERWVGATEALEFRKILDHISENLGGIHPDLFTSKIVNTLETIENFTPFTLEEIDGILMLDHDPSLPRLNLRLMAAITRFVPVHQLTYSGSYRLGEHGIQVRDIYPISEMKELPSWIPRHSLNINQTENEVHDIEIEIEKDSIRAAATFISEARLSNPNASILIIDPDWQKRASDWRRSVESIPSIIPPHELQPRLTNPLIRLIVASLSLAQGNRAFSLEKIREIGINDHLTVLQDPIPHSSNSSITPRCHLDLLEKHARDSHITGGPGAIQQWLESLSKPREPEDGKRWEELQWWILSLVNSIRHLLSDWEIESISEKSLYVGCYTGNTLQLPKPYHDSNEWLEALLSSISLTEIESHQLANNSLARETVEFIRKQTSYLARSMKSLGIKLEKSGPLWAERILRVIADPEIKPQIINDPNLRILAPKDALGCTADIVLMTHLSSTSWPMHTPRVPLLGEEDRHALNILRPDTKIKSARHSMRHLLHAAPVVAVIHVGLDNQDHPPSFILAEWLNHQHKTAKEEMSREQLSEGPRYRLMNDGNNLRSGKPASMKPLGTSSPLLQLSSDLVTDMLSRRPTSSDDDGYLPERSLSRLLVPPSENLISAPSRAAKNSPRSNQRWPVVEAGKSSSKTATIDPRPIIPWRSNIYEHDQRQGYSDITIQRKRWSPSRLKVWLDCPRRGWLTERLSISEDERTSQDLDPRVYGNILHAIHHDILSNVLGVEEGSEELEVNLENRPLSLAISGISIDDLMLIGLNSLADRAPWLTRTDAVAVQRLWMLTGMNSKEWGLWLSDPRPVAPAGRIGAMIMADIRTPGTAPIATEWKIHRSSKDLKIIIPPEFVEKNRGRLNPFTPSGLIDRVDMVPFDPESTQWVDESGSKEVAPLRVQESGWRPRRMVVIRDLKSTEASTPPQHRHKKGLFEELQLAVYARAWELAHPGDLVVGTGISVLGYESEHFVEISKWAPPWMHDGDAGTITSLTSDLYRFHDEGPQAESDPFRAWLTQRLIVASGVVTHASSGMINPTPSVHVCSFCEARHICDRRARGGFIQ